jgi:alpha-beta hydrolase superfamily lysophospholipase
MRVSIAALLIAVSSAAHAQSISVRAPDGRMLYGDLYGAGDRGLVILAHGGYSSRASWQPTAEALAAAGIRLLVIESRGAIDFAAGKETPCLSDETCQSKDVSAAIAQLRKLGAKSISLMGGSLGGAAVALAAIDAGPSAIDAIILLAPAAIPAPEKIPGRKLFIVTAGDANSAGLRLPGIKAQYARTKQPKTFVQLDGSAHGQNLFATPQGPAVIQDIARFLLSGKP